MPVLFARLRTRKHRPSVCLLVEDARTKEVLYQQCYEDPGRAENEFLAKVAGYIGQGYRCDNAGSPWHAICRRDGEELDVYLVEE